MHKEDHGCKGVRNLGIDCNCTVNFGYSDYTCYHANGPYNQMSLLV